MRKIILLLFASLLVLSGCAAVSTATSKVDLMKAPEKAYILARYNGDANIEWSNWSNFDKADVKMISGNVYKIYAVEPGRYALTDFYASMGNYTVSFKKSAKTRNWELRRSDQTLIGSFEAEAGKVTYIGDLRFSCIGNVTFSISDNYEYALNFMAEKYPEISSDKIVKKLAERGVY